MSTLPDQSAAGWRQGGDEHATKHHRLGPGDRARPRNFDPAKRQPVKNPDGSIGIGFTLGARYPKETARIITVLKPHHSHIAALEPIPSELPALVRSPTMLQHNPGR
jgi:hypothetical protein